MFVVYVQGDEVLSSSRVNLLWVRFFDSRNVSFLFFLYYISFSQLLVIDPQHRLGVSGAAQIKQHPFFSGFDWIKMAKRHVSPPFVPSVRAKVK